jgi:hypothetical protein
MLSSVLKVYYNKISYGNVQKKEKIHIDGAYSININVNVGNSLVTPYACSSQFLQ